MTNPIQLLRDFLKWRKEKYETSLKSAIAELAKNQFPNPNQSIQRTAYAMGVRDGLEHRKVILNKVKI